ncbi:Uncharacterized protein FKW44_025222 [Caligus rogercresseyi]|uniref:Uncharacterized protein n=1 Tax=Caligus rogercresseyi TaxID=217165 RepID=A0A7T8GLE7_CALRO|nr:Uncharacterized protein FKW44_025222 [Caligus rogercresseyi]
MPGGWHPRGRCHIYESLMRFHRSAAKAIQHKTSLESAYEREGFESMQDQMSLTSGILTCRHQGKGMPLTSTDTKPWAQNDSRIDVFLEPTILLPQSHLSFESLRDFPETFSIPQTRMIRSLDFIYEWRLMADPLL